MRSIHRMHLLVHGGQTSIVQLEQVLGVNEEGGRPVACRTLFYLAHCEAFISENLLGANAEPARRARLAILGNSFAAYAERWAASGSVQVRQYWRRRERAALKPWG